MSMREKNEKHPNFGGPGRFITVNYCQWQQIKTNTDKCIFPFTLYPVSKNQYNCRNTIREDK